MNHNLRLTKRERIAEYNAKYPSYNITNIKKMDREAIEWATYYGNASLYECYAQPSDTKVSTYNEILATYKPEILSVIGSAFTYSVLLRAENGDILHITKGNNYLVDVTN